MAEETEQPEQAVPAPVAAPPQRSREEILRDPLVAAAVSQLSDAVVNAREFAGEITLIIDRARIREVAEAFKRDGFRYCVDVTGVDYSKYAGHTGERFAVAYHLYSFDKNKRVRLKVFTSDGLPVPSVSSVWKTANWHERETYDMFGIQFEGHPNLERILMWEGFNGHPLRKDFPVRGIDTGARIYPEIFPPGGGPRPGSTGKDVKDVNLWKGPWLEYGKAPTSPPAPPKPPTPQITAPVPAAAAKPAVPTAAVVSPAAAVTTPATPAAVTTPAAEEPAEHEDEEADA